ncbi:MAG: hypothetical protein GC189_12830 [Alphaproteobacteria bacterium]|nr:hypothetical protein [Alphaproteobacteria bacterium]
MIGVNKHAAALAAILLTAGTLAASVTEADARGRRGSASVQTERGTYQGNASVNRQRGSRTRESTVTGPNGGQTSVRDERTWNREEGTASHDRTRTYPDGSTRSVDADAQRTGEGQWSASRTVTGRNGETRTQTGDFSATRTENGRSVTGDIQTQNAGAVQYQRDVTRQDGARTVNSTATFEDGTQVSRSSTGSCDGQGTCVRDTAVTNRQGQTVTSAESRTRTEDGAVYSRDTTFADGATRQIDRERVGNGDGTGAVNRTVTGRDGETRTQTGTYEVSPQ